jgi:TetR/AcrR family transcriptional regulator, regulator of cefoperazone and chloramphenicol sensitivity
MKGLKTKQKVIDAAISLFNVKGYDGTSVREIAKAAEVNIALVSYYFGGKKGLLEHLLASFYEGYLQELSEALNNENIDAATCLKDAVFRLLKYQEKQNFLSRFVHREMTIDTMLVREVMTTYLMKEKYLLEQLLEIGIEDGIFRDMQVDFGVMHIRNLIIMPFLHPQYMRENFYINLEEDSFKEGYFQYVSDVINTYYCKK